MKLDGIAADQKGFDKDLDPAEEDLEADGGVQGIHRLQRDQQERQGLSQVKECDAILNRNNINFTMK